MITIKAILNWRDIRTLKTMRRWVSIYEVGLCQAWKYTTGESKCRMLKQFPQMKEFRDQHLHDNLCDKHGTYWWALDDKESRIKVINNIIKQLGGKTNENN